MGALLNRREAAQRLGVSEMTIDRLRKAGRLAYVQHVPNGKVWIDEDAITEYIARGNHPVIPQRIVTNTYRKRQAKAANY